MMSEQAWTYDERPWPDGPWNAEPDKVQWTDPKTTLPCLAVRHPEMGHWCGYVGVGPDHPLYGKKYSEVSGDIDVHGGLTYSNGCQPTDDPSRGVCHVPGPGEPDKVWWFGFDCCHYMDLSPGLEAVMFPQGLIDRYEKMMGEAGTEQQMAAFRKIVGRLEGQMRGLPSFEPAFARSYKPIEYVQIECVRLARQLVTLSGF